MNYNYQEDLRTIQWRTKRQEILYRDNWHCSKCPKEQKLFNLSINDDYVVFERIPDQDRIFLEVHHLCYRRFKEPWNQPDGDYTTLCKSCHEKWHQENEIKVLDDSGILVDKCHLCDRCGGKGYIPEFSKIMNLICFNCWGNKYYNPYYINYDTDPQYDLHTDFSEIRVNDHEISNLVNYLSSIRKRENLETYFYLLGHLIKENSLSVFDERFVIVRNNPSEKPGTTKLWTQIGYFHVLGVDETYYNEAVPLLLGGSGLTQQLSTWINSTKRHFALALAPDGYKYSYYSNGIFSSELRQFHEYLIFKAAVDEDFRTELLNLVYEK